MAHSFECTDTVRPKCLTAPNNCFRDASVFQQPILSEKAFFDNHPSPRRYLFSAEAWN